MAPHHDHDDPDEAAPVASLAALERQLDRAHDEWGADDLAALFRDNEVRVLSLAHVGGDGWLKTLDFVPRNESHLRDLIEVGERADGSSLFPGCGIPPGASDIVLRPRPSTAFMDPFSPLPTLVVLCGHAGRDGRPLPQSPDTIVRAARSRLLGVAGVDLQAHGEVEFFLGKTPDDGEVYGADERGYHAASPFVFGEDLRRHALVLLADIGVAVKYGHSEVGYIEPDEEGGPTWEQHEIELALARLDAAADAIVLTHWVLRNLAHQMGMRCSTDPVLAAGHAGNGLHVHFSPKVEGAVDGGREPRGELGLPARALIAGLVRSGGALMAFGNRDAGSFVRLLQGKEAPTSVRWGEFDRSALVRLPILATAESGRPVSPPTIEFRLPDGSAMPHLLLAGAAQAMAAAWAADDVDAVLARTAVGAAAGGGTRLPRSFREVAERLRAERATLEGGGVFPPGYLDAVVERLES